MPAIRRHRVNPQAIGHHGHQERTDLLGIRRRPDAQVMVLESSTILRLCASPGYLRRPGFVASTGRGR